MNRHHRRAQEAQRRREARRKAKVAGEPRLWCESFAAFAHNDTWEYHERLRAIYEAGKRAMATGGGNT